MNIPHQYQLLTAQESRELDERTISEFGISGFTLMEIAGTRAADFIMETVEPKSRALICCGTGNNAGDALVVARILAENGFQISILLAKGVDNLSPDCAKNWELFQNLGHDYSLYSSVDEIKSYSFDFVVDGLLGTGLKADLRTPYNSIVHWINEHSPLTFSMDVPTGLSSDTGKILGAAISADYTLTFGVLKVGFFMNSGYECCGEIILCELPFPSKFKNSPRYLIDEYWMHEAETSSPQRKHKYDGGVVYVIAGSEGLTGAAALACKSAWGTGVGAVVLITPKGLLDIYEKSLIQIIKKPVGMPEDRFFTPNHLVEIHQALEEKPGVLLLGPGLGRHPETVVFVQQLLAKYSGSAIIDADGLFAIAQQPIQKPDNAEWVLTPHPGELSTLFPTNFASDYERMWLVSEFAKKHTITIVSKGLPSIIATTHGYILLTGYDTRIFSRAGFGDVLAGKLAGFLLLKKTAELAACFALTDGKSKADAVILKGDHPLEPIDLI